MSGTQRLGVLLLLALAFAAGWSLSRRVPPSGESPLPAQPGSATAAPVESAEAKTAASVPRGGDGGGAPPQLAATPSPPSGRIGARDLSGFELLEEEQDLFSILQLIFDLIRSRDFARADQAIQRTLDGLNGGKIDSPLWKGAASVPPTLLRLFQEDAESSMEYLLHLARAEALPVLLEDLLHEVLEGEMGTLLLGLNDGRLDPWVSELVPYYRERIAGWSRSTYSDREVVRSLGLIPTEEAAIVLIDLRSWAASNLKLDLIQALATNGTAPARAALREWGQEETNRRFRRAIDDALRLLEP
ncbi:MAG: hypothetical protein ACYTGJ_11685 [Planctomycetota bacterium]